MCVKWTCKNIVAALFVIAKDWKQPKHKSVGEWVSKWWYICSMEYYAVFLKKWWGNTDAMSKDTLREKKPDTRLHV